MGLLCPSCRQSIAVTVPPDRDSILCPSCGSTVPVGGHVDPAQLTTPRKEDVSTIDHVPTDSVDTTPQSPKPTPSGKKLPAVPGYEVVSQLGRGGMGVVFLARQEGLNRLIALKMIRSAELAGADEIARFRAEAEAAARLQHPNIVQIHAVGESDGQPFFSLEYVEGGTLKDYLAGKPQDPRQAAQLVESLARAVEIAHQRDIVHRDLKPGNVLLARTAERPAANTSAGEPPTLSDFTPKITDFGLAKLLDADSTRTVSGAIVGTPAYMAPEQAAGRGNAISRTTDVWALGAILYEMLTGRPPFHGATTRDTLDQVLNTEPVSPSRLQPRLARDLETICLKCLQKEPHRRYASARELADDLRRFQAGEPITARPVGAIEQFWLFCRRKPLVAAVVLLGLCLAVGSTVAALVINADRNDLEKQTQRANQKTKEADDNARTAGQKQKEAEEEKERTKTALGVVEKQKGEIETALGNVTRAQAETQVALTDKNKALIETRVQLYHSKFALAERRWQEGEIPDALRLLQECPKEYRSWEWHYLNRQCRPELLSLSSEGGSNVQFTKSGRHLLVTTRLRDLDNPAPPGGEKAPPREPITSIWSWISGKKVFESRGWGDHLLSEGGERLAVITREKDEPARQVRNGKVMVLDGVKGTELFAVPGEGFPVQFSRDARLLAVGRRMEEKIDDKTQYTVQLEIFDLVEKKSLLKLDKVGSPVQFSPDGKYVTGRLHTPRQPGAPPKPPAPPDPPSDNVLWEVASGKEVLRTRSSGHIAPLFSPGGKLLLTRDETNELVDGKYVRRGETTLWNLVEGNKVFSEPIRSSQAQFSPDGRCFMIRPETNEPRDPRTRPLVICDSVTGKRRFEIASAPEPVRFSRDGRRLLWADAKTFQARDLETGKEVPTTAGDAVVLNAALFGPEGAVRASGDLGSLSVSAGGRRLITVPSGVEMGWTEPGRVSVSPDGKQVAIVSQSLGEGYRTIEVWDVATNKRVRHFHDPGQSYSCVVFSPDGTRLAGAGNSNLIRVWDVATGQEVARLRGHQAIDKADPDPLQLGMKRLTFSPDGLALISEGRGTVKVWDVANDSGQMQLEERGDMLFELKFSDEGNRLLVMRSDSDPQSPSAVFYRIHDTLTGNTLHEFKRPEWRTAQFSPEGRWASTWTGTPARPPARQPVATLQVHDVLTWEVFLEMPAQLAEFDPVGKSILVLSPPAEAGKEPTAKVWDIAAKKELYQLSGCDLPTKFRYPFSPDGKRLIYPGKDGSLVMLDAATGKTLYEIKAALSHLRYNFSPDSLLFITVKGTALEVRDCATGEVRHTLDLGETLTVFDFTEDNKRLTALGRQGRVRMWDVATGKELTTLEVGPGDARLYGPAERILRTTRKTQKVNNRDVVQLEVHCWDLTTGRESVTTVDHLGSNSKLTTFSQDGRRLACVRGPSAAVELWDLASGQQILTLPGARMFFRSLLAFSPDGRRLAAGGIELTMWDAADAIPGQENVRLEASAHLRLATHSREANKAIDNRQPELAVFHLDRLIEYQPANPALRMYRAGFQAERELWDEVVLDLREAMQRGNRDARLLPQYALALVQSGDRQGWQRFCEQIVANVKETDSPEVVGLVLQSCLVAPDALKDMKKLMPLLEKVVKSTRNRYSARLLTGATLHRVGEAEKAIEELKEADKLVGREAMNTPEHLLVLALCHVELKQAQEAKEVLKKAGGYVHMLKTTPETPMLFRRPAWHVLARYDLLQKEVEARMNEKSE